MTVQFNSEQAVQFLESCLVIGMIVPRHLVERLASRLGTFPFPFSFQGHVGNLRHQELRHAGIRVIGILEHDSESDPLAMAFGHVERNLPTLGEIQLAGTRLDVAPVETHVDFLRERETDQVLAVFLERVSLCARRPVVAGHVDREAHPVVGDDVAGGRRGHDHVAAGHHFLWRVLREGALVKTIRH